MSKIAFRENFKIDRFKNKTIIIRITLIEIINIIRYSINKRIEININQKINSQTCQKLSRYQFNVLSIKQFNLRQTINKTNTISSLLTILTTLNLSTIDFIKMTIVIFCNYVIIDKIIH